MIDDKDRFQVMVGEYRILKEEMKVYIDLFHRNTNFVTVYGSLLVGAIGLVASTHAKDFKLPQALLESVSLPVLGVVIRYQLLAFCAYIATALIGFFFVAATFSYIYIIEVLASRAASVERLINEGADATLLIWETGISPRLIRNLVFHRGWIGPSTLRIASSFAVLLLVLIVQAITARALMGSALASVFFVFVIVVSTFYAIQAILYRRIGVPFIHDVVEREGAGGALTRGAAAAGRSVK